VYGVLSLFFSVFAMMLLFFGIQSWGAYTFGLSLLLLLGSLGVSFWEISISVKALRIHLSDLIEEAENNTRK
jgi:hypothetical protein